MAYEPWIGKDYNLTRFLLLGESTYSWIENNEVVHPSLRHSIGLVEYVIEAFPTDNRFINMLSRALVGEEWPNKAQLEEAWARVAFTNYVEGSVGIGPDNRPTDNMWRSAGSTFPKLLASLRPKNIIVLGKDIWKWMPPSTVKLTNDVQGYRLADGEMAICWAVNHPSARAGTSWKKLAALVQFARDREIKVIGDAI